MANIFRLQNDNYPHDLANTIRHWDVSKKYDDNQINAIESTNIHTYHQPTSIPSPFARIALVKTAFAEVARHKENALKAYQKIVSDTLDVAEVFLTYEKWRNKIEIITWKFGRNDHGELMPDSHFRQLQQTHRRIFETFKTFFENDAIEYNFDKLKSIYILKYIPSGQIIGATSPCTLFMSSPNAYNNIDIFLGNRRIFDGIVPLSQRNRIFQKYLYSWIHQFNENRNINGIDISIFDDWYRYLISQREFLDNLHEIDNLHIVDENLFKVHHAPDVEIIGKPLHFLAENIPEYWTVDDIFENSIIKIPYSIDNESFFDGNLHPVNNQLFLLPLKDLVFKYYSIDDLLNRIKINSPGNVVEVKLKIDQQPQELSRKYSKFGGNNTLPIIPLNIDCALFPNIKFYNENSANYRFGIVCNFNQGNNFDIKFVKKINREIHLLNSTRRTIRNQTKVENLKVINFSLENSNFDYIRLFYNNKSGIIIPKFHNHLELDVQYIFAVDFGTTNTHVEYKDNHTLNPHPFTITTDEKGMVHYLHGGEEYKKRYFDEEYIPKYTNNEFKFPLRTALSYGENTIWVTANPFEEASLNELFEKRPDLPYNRTITNLKWSNDDENRNKVRLYIESLMFLLRNKVLLNNGRLRATKIVWFYPSSMETGRYLNFKQIFENSYRKYFFDGINDIGITNNIISIPESVAPHLLLSGLHDAGNFVTVDIGGNTTDVAISVDNQLKYITSFRFAANTVFGNGYNEINLISNKMVEKHYNKIREILNGNINVDYIQGVFNHIYGNYPSEDVASFLFAINNYIRNNFNNPVLADNVDLIVRLRDDQNYKIVFLLFYAAIVYHLAKLFKALNIPIPNKIYFSGNGSKLLYIITSHRDHITEFTRKIFKNAYNDEIENELPFLNVEINDINPKEVTCLGGLRAIENNNFDNFNFDNILAKTYVLHGDGSQKVFKILSNDNMDKYSAIDENYLSNIINEIISFKNAFFKSINVFHVFGYEINDQSISRTEEIFNMDHLILNYAKRGYQLRMKIATPEETIKDSPFFYPLVGIINHLINNLP